MTPRSAWAGWRWWCTALALGVGLFQGVAWAQTPRAADFIVAVVNSEPITYGDLSTEMQRVARELRQQRQSVPSESQLRSEVLERLINEKAQLQFAQESGLRVDDFTLEQAEQSIARQNQIDVAELRRRIAAQDGLDAKGFRERLRNQITLQRLLEREVESRIRVSDAEVERRLSETRLDADPMAHEINLANLLVPVPESASPEQVQTLQAQAQRLLGRLRAGEQFDTLVQELPAGERGNSGPLGLRRADRYPPLFVEATKNVAVGQVSELLRSPAGFHVLQVLERRVPSAAAPPVVQHRAAHILLRPSAQQSPAQALERLATIRRAVQGGTTTFAAMARQHSQDASAEQGGDLGWASPGLFVPEFEEVLQRLAPGQMSEPTLSRFGAHLILLQERRTVELSEREARELVRKQLREARYEEAYGNWAREVRGRAFVEIREES